MRTLELNADVGELPGPEGRAADRAILGVVNAASIACGAHAGDDETMRATLALCAELGVVPAAHPGYPDREGFGRRRGGLTAEAIGASVRAQLERLLAHAAALGIAVDRVKAHGALYNEASADRSVAGPLLEAIGHCLPGATVVGLAASPFLKWAREAGFATLAEGFADRGYRSDGTLVPRSAPGALIEDEDEAARHAVRLAVEGMVVSVDGSEVRLAVETLCLHGDKPGAAARARAVRRALEAAGVTVAATESPGGPGGSRNPRKTPRSARRPS